jgi:two-component system, OmpR family, sensor histidine kinase KdpD
MNQPQPATTGRLKIYLSYAAGAGKTYRMMDDAQEAKRHGVDVVIGYFESHGRKDTIAKTEGLEVIPRKKVQYRNIVFEEMDTPAILYRAPRICLVDEFAHTNVPTSKRAKRWEDALFLLDHGIDVWTTMNLQHLESLNDQVLQISGVRVRETVPDWVIKQADEVVMVDVTPEALMNRLKRGAVYDTDKAERALSNFFKEQTLAALRELTFRQAALELETRHSGIRPGSTGREVQRIEERAAERILIHITSDPATAMLIRRGHRVAEYLRAECFAVYVSQISDLSVLPIHERDLIERHLDFARNLRIETRVLQSAHVSQGLVEFAHSQRITHLFLARPTARYMARFFGEKVISEVLRHAKDMQIIIVAKRGPQKGALVSAEA